MRIDSEQPYTEMSPLQASDHPASAQALGDGQVATSAGSFISYFPSSPTDLTIGNVRKPKEMYECGRCGKHFGRLDHVKRHCRSHSDERSHLCKFCPKTFNRKDLLDRHSATHGVTEYNKVVRAKRRERAVKACDQCIQAKTRCSNERPCQRCRERGKSCGSTVQVSRQPPSESQFVTSVNEASSADVSNTAAIVAQREDGLVGDHGTMNQEVSGDAHVNMDWRPVTSQSMIADQGSEDRVVQEDIGFWETNFPLNDIQFDTEGDILAKLDLDWTSIFQPGNDLGSETYNDSCTTLVDSCEDSANTSQPPRKSVREFYGQCLWLWEADEGDPARTEDTPHLMAADERALLCAEATRESSANKVVLPAALLEGVRCRNDARDALLIMMQQNSGPSAKIRCFPSTEVLSFLLKTFAVHEALGQCPFIHLPSFKWSECEPELMSALIAVGCANLPNHQIWKLGLALQSRIRSALYNKLGLKGPIWQDLDIIRAQILWIEASLWSGVRSKMELAESAAGAMSLMIRNAAGYNLDDYEKASTPSPGDDDEVLQEKWMKWMEIECFKRPVHSAAIPTSLIINRCALRAFVNDIQGSVAFTRNPRFSSTELTFGLPAAKELWIASSPLAWKDAFLVRKLTVTSKLTPLQIVQDPSTLQSLPDASSREIGAFVALHYLWSQIAAFHEARNMDRGYRHSSKMPTQSSLRLEAQRQDLYTRLADIRGVLGATATVSCETQAVCECFMMALFVSFVDIEKFVGRFGSEESRSAAQKLQAWSASEESCHAVWHAGQVLKAAADMNPMQLRHFYSWTVYQACVVLALPLVVEAVSKSCGTENSTSLNGGASGPHQQRYSREYRSHMRDEVNLVVLNGPENMQTRSYLVAGQGQPALLLGDTLTPISSIDVIPTVITKIFRNGLASTEALLPSSERMMALLIELTKFTGC